jgi:hypothetical protein
LLSNLKFEALKYKNADTKTPIYKINEENFGNNEKIKNMAFANG